MLRPARNGISHDVYSPHEILESAISLKVGILSSFTSQRVSDLAVPFALFRTVRQVQSFLSDIGRVLNCFTTSLPHGLVDLERGRLVVKHTLIGGEEGWNKPAACGMASCLMTVSVTEYISGRSARY
jgi:hypothetical protein